MIELKGIQNENSFFNNMTDIGIDFVNYNFHYMNEFNSLSNDSKNRIRTLAFRQREKMHYPLRTEFQITSFHDNLMEAIRMFPNLTNLTLENYPLLTDDQFGTMSIAVFENLTTICLSKNSSLSCKTFRRIANNCTLLKTIDFSCRFYLGNSFLKETNNLAGERYYNLCSQYVLKLLRNNLQLNIISLMMKAVTDNMLNRIAELKFVERVYLIVEDKDSINVKSFVQILSKPQIKYFGVSLNLNQFMIFNDDRELQMSNPLELTYNEIWTEELIQICTSVKNIKSIEVNGFLLTDDFCTALCTAQSNIAKIICEDCKCDFTTGFVVKLISSCPHLQFLFLEGTFVSISQTVLSLFYQKIIVAIVVKNNPINGRLIKVLRKLIRKIQGTELDFTVDCFLCNNSFGDNDDDDDDETDDAADLNCDLHCIPYTDLMLKRPFEDLYK